MGWDTVTLLGFYVFSFVIGILVGWVASVNRNAIWPRFNFQEKLKFRLKKAKK